MTKKKFLTTKKKFPIIIATFVLLLIVVIFACEQDYRDSSFEKDEAQVIEQAKLWYEMNKPVETGFRFSDGKKKIPAKPEWKNAFTEKNSQYEVVETDLMTLGRFMYVNPECMEKFNETNDPKYRQCYSRIVFRTDRKTGETAGFMMTFVPDMEWLKKSNFQPFREATYLNRGKDYGGLVLFHYMDGSFSNGWRYEKGKITRKISNMDGAPVEFRSTDCETYYDITVFFECPIWFTGSEFHIFDPDYCWIVDIIYHGSHEECPDNGTGGGGGPSSSSTAGPRDDCTSQMAANNTTTNTTLNSTYGTAEQVKSNADTLRNYAKNSSNEWGMSIDYNGSQYLILNQNINVQGSNPLYLKEGTSNEVAFSYSANTYMCVHTHSGNTNSPPSPADAINLVKRYTGYNGLTVAQNIQASVIFTKNGTEYMIYVSSRTLLNIFCQGPNSDFFLTNGQYFGSNTAYAERYSNAFQNLKGKGYSDIDAYCYALTHVLDYYNTGLKVYKKEPGKTDFKEQKANGITVGGITNIYPQICP